jgi:hypothetical protein
MDNPWDTMRQAVRSARNTMRAADDVATDLARLLDGRLRTVGSGDVLARLKMELRHFNAHTKEWKK